MLEIPAWAIGVAAICGGVGIMVLIMQLGEGLQRSLFGIKRGGRKPSTVIGMHVGTSSGETTQNPEAVEDLQRRVAELEERVDFAERLLAKQAQPDRLINRE